MNHEKSGRLSAKLIIPLGLTVLSGILRKFIPGQPNYIEVLPAFGVLVAFAMTRGSVWSFPRWLQNPLLCIVTIQVFYVILGIFYEWQISALAIVTRLFPILLVLIAYRTISTTDQVLRMGKLLTIVALTALPGAVIQVFFSPETVPAIFQPIDAVKLAGKVTRSGIDAYTGLFSTPWIASLAMLACVFFCVAGLIVARQLLDRQIYLIIGLSASLLLLYLTTRRGALIMALFGVLIPLLIRKSGRIRYAVGVMAALLLVWYVTSSEKIRPQKGGYESRMEFSIDLDPTQRVSNVFIPLFLFWTAEAPLGNQLGWAGPEAAPFLGSWRIRDLAPVEVGAAMIVAEMGILGLIVFTGGLVVIWMRFWRSTKHSQNYYLHAVLLGFQVCYFILFFTKELLDLANVSLGQFMFWTSIGIQAALINKTQVSNPNRMKFTK